MRLCLFCSRRADSIEDAWPRWITNQFKGQLAPVEAERGGTKLPSWKVHQPTLKIRCVCKHCNNDWMSRLEGRVRPYLQPLLLGQSATLDSEGQTTIAVWAVKTAMVLEGMEAADKSGYSQLQRERMRLRNEIPWRTSVWLAAAAEPHWFMSTKNRHLGESGDISGVSITMGFAHLVLQVMTIRVPQEVGPESKITTEVRKGPWNDLTVQVWPPGDRAGWPRTMGLNGEAGLDAFAERFSTIGVSPTDIETMAI